MPLLRGLPGTPASLGASSPCIGPCRVRSRLLSLRRSAAPTSLPPAGLMRFPMEASLSLPSRV
eukprot:14877484-Alexandrium_andersonii.AAC.1